MQTRDAEERLRIATENADQLKKEQDPWWVRRGYRIYPAVAIICSLVGWHAAAILLAILYLGSEAAVYLLRRQRRLRRETTPAHPS